MNHQRTELEAYRKTAKSSAHTAEGSSNLRFTVHNVVDPAPDFSARQQDSSTPARMYPMLHSLYGSSWQLMAMCCLQQYQWSVRATNPIYRCTILDLSLPSDTALKAKLTTKGIYQELKLRREKHSECNRYYLISAENSFFSRTWQNSYQVTSVQDVAE